MLNTHRKIFKFMIRFLLLAIGAFVPYFAFGQDVDILLTNFQNSTPATGLAQVELHIKAASGSFTLGQRNGSASIIRVTHNNDGTGTGQMQFAGFDNTISNYNTTNSSGSGFIDVNITRTGFSGLNVSTTYIRVATLVYEYGAGTSTSDEVTLGITLGNTNIRDGSNNILTNNSGTGISNQQLPITLKSFNLTYLNEKVTLDWTTANEENNEGFEIQRSYDGITFDAIGFVKGSGNSLNPIEYSYTDPLVINGASGNVFYRIRQIDYDGKYNFTPTRLISLNGESKLIFYPNPAENLITIQSNETVSVEIMDLTGKVVLRGGNLNSSTIDITSIAKGTYMIIMKNMSGEILKQDKLLVK